MKILMLVLALVLAIGIASAQDYTATMTKAYYFDSTLTGRVTVDVNLPSDVLGADNVSIVAWTSTSAFSRLNVLAQAMDGKTWYSLSMNKTEDAADTVQIRVAGGAREYVMYGSPPTKIRVVGVDTATLKTYFIIQLKQTYSSHF